MRRIAGTDERWRLLVHATLVLAALCTYLKEPNDIVWWLIKSTPDVRAREHLCFAAAAAALGFSLWLRATTDIEFYKSEGDSSRFGLRQIFSDLLQAVGIGSLMPLPGFILLVAGETVFTLHRYRLRINARSDLAEVQDLKRKHVLEGAVGNPSSWKEPLAEHVGLCCAFLSMVAFSITLSDRLADLLFAGSALVTLFAFLLRRSGARDPAR